MSRFASLEASNVLHPVCLCMDRMGKWAEVYCKNAAKWLQIR